MNPIPEVRPSPIAGSWYPGDATTLAKTVDQFLHDAALEPMSGEVIGLIAPHAGHIYSGATAGYSFKAVQGKSFDRVAVLSPLHQYHFAPLLTTAHSYYETPLGRIKVDRESLNNVEGLLKQDGLEITPIAFDKEHSLEIELPFLQRALKGNFELLPIMVRSQDPAQLKLLANALAEILKGTSVLLVASTDLSHFYTLKEAGQLDGEMLRQIGLFSPDGVLHAEESGEGAACGASAVAAVLWAAKGCGGTDVQVLHHSTSADATGDTSSVVGYGAAAILKR